MVFQHFSLFESLTVAENLILGMNENISLTKLKDKSKSICDKYGFNLNLNSPISSSICWSEAIRRNCKIIIE